MTFRRFFVPPEDNDYAGRGPAPKINLTEARKMRAKGMTYRQIAERFGVAACNVCAMLKRRAK